MADRTLVIDTATPACSVALFEKGVLLSGRYEELGRGHAERLVPMIAELPDAGKAGRIVINHGPGSFTGIRIGLATARALALVWNSEIRTYATHSLVAAMARQNDKSAASMLVAMQGGHGELFVQRFGADGRAADAVRSVPLAHAAKLCQAGMVAGSAAAMLAQDSECSTVAPPTFPDARAWPLLNEDDCGTDISPQYGRPPDAKRPG